MLIQERCVLIQERCVLIQELCALMQNLLGPVVGVYRTVGKTRARVTIRLALVMCGRSWAGSSFRVVVPGVRPRYVTGDSEWEPVWVITTSWNGLYVRIYQRLVEPLRPIVHICRVDACSVAEPGLGGAGFTASE